MPIIAIVILVNSRQDKSREDKTRWHIHRFAAYNHKDNHNHNDNDDDNHYSMNSDGVKIIS